MSGESLKQRVRARDRLLTEAQSATALVGERVLKALNNGDVGAAREAAIDHEAQLMQMTEHLRLYQAELHAQADELAASQARTSAELTRFAALFSHLPLPVLLVATNGEVLDANEAAQRFFELPAAGIAVRFMHRLVDVDQFRSEVRPAFLRAGHTGAARVNEISFVCGKGQHYNGDMHIARLLSATGGDSNFACAIVDRTAQLRDQRALRELAESLRHSEAFLADAARVARTGGWDLTLDTRAMRWSPQLRELLDATLTQDASLEALLDMCAPHDHAALASAFALAERGAPFRIEVALRPTGRRPLHVLVAGQAETSDGVVTRIHGVLQDVSKQHRIQQQVQDLSERLDIANEAGGIGVWDCDIVEHGVVFDDRMRSILGMRGDSTRGATLGALMLPYLHADSAALLDAAMQAALDQRQPFNLELQLAGKEGQPERWLHLSGRAHANAEGRTVRLVGCAWDSSLQHEAMRILAAKEAAESSSRAKSTFLSRMSHELRTPLNAILGFTQIMRMESESGDHVVKPKRLAMIESAAHHLLELVNEVLDVTRIESGHMQLNIEDFSAEEVVEEAIQLVQPTGNETKISLRAACEPGARIRADRLRFKEVLINLLSNAIKYNKPGGQVRLSVAAQGGQAVVRVSDSGQGLKPGQIEELFAPFNRAGAETSKIEGTGMGLFICKRFVELMGGRIDVLSNPGLGSTFTVRLPAPPEP
jgi:two-component system, cell cycle sensor histidine kinase PleC